VKELYDKTGHGALFTSRLDQFVKMGPSVFYSDRSRWQSIEMVTLDLEGREKRAGASARSLVRLGYQAWVGLAIILMLEPSNFQTIDEGFKFFPAAKNLAFFREKMKLTALSSSPNLVFHSSFLNCWIGIAFEPDQWEARISVE